MFRISLITLGLLSLVPLALGFAGRELPLGESLAVFRGPNILASSILILLFIRRKFVFIVLPILLVCAASMGIHYIPSKTKDESISHQSSYKLYQKNLLFLNKDTSALKADIIASKADFITFQEVSRVNSAILSELQTTFPYQHTCPFSGVGGVSILSNWPDLGENKCFNKDGMTAMKIITREGPTWLISIHLHWPYPYGQAKQVKRLVKHIESLEGPKIIAGDFNMVPWSHTLNAFEQASGTQMAGSTIHSLRLPYIPMTIPIDHVLVPAGAEATTQRRDKKGSDHYGILAEFSLP